MKVSGRSNEKFIHVILDIVLFQVSDDEDDTHPNIDTPSLFKWRHEARVKRMEEMEAKKKAVVDEKKKYVQCTNVGWGAIT